MRTHLEAIKARLTDTAPTFLVWAVGESRYFVLTSPAWDPSREVPVCGATQSLDTEVRVKAVTGTPEGVLTMLDLVRDELSPGLRSTPLVVAGRSATVKFVRSEFVDVDDSTVITGTDRHPAVGVDTYRIVSEPA